MMAPRLLRPLADLPLALLWAALAGSALGDQLFAVVLSWVAAAAFGPAAGYLSTVQAGVLCLTLLASGGWADRCGRFAVMIGADLARGAALLGLILLWPASGTPAGWSLALAVLVLAAGMALFRPALQAALPGLASTGMLPATNALLDSTDRIARLLGPGLVTLTAAWLPLIASVGFDAATFFISAAAVGIVSVLRRLPPTATSARVPASNLASLREGFTVLRAHRLLFAVLAITGPIMGIWWAAYFLGVPLMLDGAGIGSFGLVISAYGSTNLLGTLLIGNLPLPARPRGMIFAGVAIGGTGVMLLGLAGMVLPPDWRLTAFCAAAALGAVGGPMEDIPVAVLRQTELPAGQIAAAVRLFMLASNLGLLVTLGLVPSLFSAIGVAPAVLMCGAAYLVCTVLGLWMSRPPRA